MDEYNLLSGYVEADAEKRELLSRLLSRHHANRLMAIKSQSRSIDLNEASLERKRRFEICGSRVEHDDLCEDFNFDMESDDLMDEDASDGQDYDFDIREYFENDRAVLRSPFSRFKASKICPECGRKFPDIAINCPECLVMLKSIDDKVNVRDVVSNPKIEYVEGSNSFDTPEELLSAANICKVADFDFTMDDFSKIMRSIKSQGFDNLNCLVKKHLIDMDSLDITDKIILIAKSFVPVEYKAYGRDLGYFEFDRIYIDDRQLDSLLITTVIHELTHFFMKEILAQVLCRLLDMSKTPLVEALVTYILSYSTLNKLIDEYAAHSVEGRFTVFGYQDYSSFMALQGDLDEDNADIAKTIGNTFSIHIKDMLEAFIDWDLRDEIKNQFIHDTTERPDYRRLLFESSSKLNDEGFLKAIWLILYEGIQDADLDKVIEYEKEF